MMHSFPILSFLSLAPLALANHAGGSTLQLKRATCSTPQGSGTCVSTASCSGFSIAGYCPGAANIQCCISKSCSVGSGSGTCLNTSKGCAGGSFQGEVCPGDESIKCCVQGGTSSSAAPAPSSSSSAGGGGGGGGGGSGGLNAASLSLIKSEEGFRANSYTIDGDKTIGYGHDCTQKGDCAGIPDPISESQAADLLTKDLASYESCVCQQPNAGKLNANQFGALTSFTYNAGCGGLKSAFGSYFASGDFEAACAAFPSKITNGGELTGRREKEEALCKTGTSDKGGC